AARSGLWAGGLAGLVGLVPPGGFPVVAAALLAVWLLAPPVAWVVSRPRRVAEPPLHPAQRRELRLIARRTWDFFETFVGHADHGLPPDNFQESPAVGVAHRTSPTNIGLYLLSTLTAHDLGYLTRGEMAERLRLTLDTLDRLERFRGHFLNWYETTSLAALAPG